MFNRVIVPLDGSPLAEAALPTAVQLAREIILLRVPLHQDVLVTAAGGADMPLLLASVADEQIAEAGHGRTCPSAPMSKWGFLPKL